MSHHILDFCHNNLFLVAHMALLVTSLEETFNSKNMYFCPPPDLSFSTLGLIYKMC